MGSVLKITFWMIFSNFFKLDREIDANPFKLIRVRSPACWAHSDLHPSWHGDTANPPKPSKTLVFAGASK